MLVESSLGTFVADVGRERVRDRVGAGGECCRVTKKKAFGGWRRRV